MMRLRLFSWLLLLLLSAPQAIAGAGVHTTYLWHMHQPIYWPAASTWNPVRYETAYETITLGHSQNDVFTIFNKDDRVADYQGYPRDAISSVLDLPDAGAQMSFAGALIENISSLGAAGWNGGRYASNWYGATRQAMGWTTSRGQRRLEPVLAGFHHAIGPLMDDKAFRMELATAREIWGAAWGSGPVSTGFFPAEMCFSERLIPALVDAGVTWSVVPDLHLGRAAANYPYTANLDNCDPPNRADQTNADQPAWTNHTISRGVTLKVPYPFGFTPHRGQYVDPATGAVSQLVVVPAANAMGWEEGYGLFGTGGVDAIATANNPAQPMLILFAHDGDNAWSGGYSYYNENVTQFAHAAVAKGYTPTTVATYLDEFPVPVSDVVHVEDGGWVNADGDFGSPQFINWNWPLVDAGGGFDIPAGWAEDERNWAILTAAQNRVETAAEIMGTVNPAVVAAPGTLANDAERAWHFLLAGYESGYMYYGTALDMEIKATVACNEAVGLADPVIAGGSDVTAPTIWLPQRLPWNPGGFGGGAMWGWPSGDGAPMSSDFFVWSFAHDVSGLVRVDLMVREDADGQNDPATLDNEVYTGGSEVGTWTALPMNKRTMPKGEPWPLSGVDLTVLPDYIADQYWLAVPGFSDVLLDYYVEAEDATGRVKRSPIQHVYVGTGDGGGGGAAFAMDGGLDAGVQLTAAAGSLSLWSALSDSLLYLATDAGGGDVFLLLGDEPQTMIPAPWAKSGQVPAWRRLLAHESTNGWSGWFDGAQNVLNDPTLGLAAGTVLEGVVNLNALYPAGWPGGVNVSVGVYGTADGEDLIHQIPSGDGDGNMDVVEQVLLPLGVSAAPLPVAPVVSLTAWPSPFNARVNLKLGGLPAGPVAVDIFDTAGRRLRRLNGETVGNSLTVIWDGRDSGGRNQASGVYLARIVGQGGTRPVRLVLVK